MSQVKISECKEQNHVDHRVMGKMKGEVHQWKCSMNENYIPQQMSRSLISQACLFLPESSIQHDTIFKPSGVISLSSLM